jgi:hypothetical protein
LTLNRDGKPPIDAEAPMPTDFAGLGFQPPAEVPAEAHV